MRAYLKIKYLSNDIINSTDKVEKWDIDNKFIKPIFDSLIISNVIEDDNINKVFYCAKGEIRENPHTEVYITDVNNSVNLFKSMLV